jgi:hypothetical protein
MGMRRRLLAAMALVLGGCVPDLGQWEVVEPGTDAGVLPGTDGGSAQPNPIDLGSPCPNPHLLLGASGGSETSAHVLRVDPASDSLCRNGTPIVEQRAFGYAIRDVDWHAETGEVLGLDQSVLGLDEGGFPSWRYEPFAETYFGGDWVAAFGSGANGRIAVAWAQSSSSIDQMLLLDARGNPTNTQIAPPFSGAMIAAHPDGSGRLLIPSSGGDNIEVFSVSDATGPLGDGDATPLWPGTPPSLYDTYGERVHIAPDVATHRLVITHSTGVALWQVGAPAPTTAVGCPSYCDGFQASAPDPNADDGVYAICDATSSSARHLVHIRSGSCSLVIDGTSLDHYVLQDVALVRAPL